MRKFIVGALIALAGFTTLSTPASAAQPDSVLDQCQTDTKYQGGDGITVQVWFQQDGIDCRLRRIMAWSSQGWKNGHFNLFGPDGYNRNSVTKRWEWGEGFNDYPGYVTRRGHLWCAKFYNDNGTPATGNICVTV